MKTQIDNETEDLVAEIDKLHHAYFFNKKGLAIDGIAICGFRRPPGFPKLGYVPKDTCPICLALYNDHHGKTRS